jgi:predicted adenine nucleotide alpha hydrolase (AANH) superfamily ATPase
MLQLDVIFHEEYTPKDFFDELPRAKAARCTHCYSIRLKATAKAAKAGGFDYFSTSLLYSRHQNHEEIIELARGIADDVGIPFFYEDFRVGWQDGIDASKDMALYRQKYCGCIFSLSERGKGKDVSRFIAKVPGGG